MSAFHVYAQRAASRLLKRASASSSTSVSSTLSSPTPSLFHHHHCRAFSSFDGLTTYAWGNGFSEGMSAKLGRQSSSAVLQPQLMALSSGETMVQIDFSTRHAAVLSETGAVYTYGLNKEGELGLGDKEAREQPTRLDSGALPDDIVQVSTGHDHSAALTSDGHVYTWGAGGTIWSGCGGLGHGDRQDQLTPKRVEALVGVDVKQVVCGMYQTFAITGDGKVFSWGRGEYGRLGLGDSGDYKSPEPLDALAHKHVTKIATVGGACAALTDDGELHTWGRNEYSQLGVIGGVSMEVYATEPAPVRVDTLAGIEVVDVDVGERHMTCATREGRLYLWGNRSWPTPYLLEGDDGVLAPTKFVAVGAGNKFSAAMTDEGALYTWGSGRSCGLGHGDTTSHTHPTEVLGMTGVVSLFAGGSNCAVFVK